MKNRTGKLMLVLVLANGFIGQLALQAQSFSPPLTVSSTGTNPIDFEVRADGTFIMKGNFGTGSLLSTDQGAGTRLLFFPDLSAFRAGTVTGTDWNTSNIGQYSTAMGLDDIALGYGSVALGVGNNATQDYGVAIGENCTAYLNGVALGQGSSTSWSGVSIGTNCYGGWSGNAIGTNCNAAYGAVAIGSGASATNNWACVVGANSSATALGSVAIGINNYASSYCSLAMGLGTYASGNYTATFNYTTHANAYCSTAMGQYNVGGGNATAWIPTDPLFELGNGQGAGQPVPYSDAFVVYKNGNATFQGSVNIAPGGDIPMYSGS